VAGTYPAEPGASTGGLSGATLAVVVSLVTTVSNILFETIAGSLVEFQHNVHHSTKRQPPHARAGPAPARHRRQPPATAATASPARRRRRSLRGGIHPPAA
jgi:hypothetical protein